MISAKITSPRTPTYNCIAWAAGDSVNWWEPVGCPPYYWPNGIALGDTLDFFIQAYSTKGFSVCSDKHFEQGFEKIAIYVDDNNRPKHAARQIDQQIWTSKLGQSFDVDHPFVDIWSQVMIEGQIVDLSGYGSLGQILKREVL